MKTVSALTLLCIAVGMPALALSAPPAAPAAADKFVQMDTSKDGKVTWEEFHATYPQMQQAAFDGIDANKDKAINREEWDAFLAQHSMGRANTPGGMGGGMGMPPKANSDMPKSDTQGAGSPPLMITPPAK